MAWTSTTLKQAIQDYCETNETTFVNNLDNIILQAEDRILKTVQLPDFRKNSTGIITGNDQYLGWPGDFLAPYSLAVDNSGYEFLIFKDVNFIRQAYPTTSTTGVPKYYATFQEGFFIVGPTPNQNYAVELHYFYKPQSITTAGTSWLGSNAESSLLYGCLVEAYTFLKGDADMMQIYMQRYEDALGKLKVLGEGYNRTDSYRSG
jgi:hypothetical protein